jgi:type I restriction enzyme R subunit
MYVDKPLTGIKAVQTLSRLNRSMPGKNDTFVLDFFNETDDIRDAFQDFYQTTILSRDADPNKLHDLKDTLDAAEVYAWEEVEQVAARFLSGEDRQVWQPILDVAIARYNALAELEAKITFKHQAKTFVRAYNFLAAVLPYGNPEWEELSIYLTFLTPSLPSPEIDDLAKGVLQTVDMDSYRAEKQGTVRIYLESKDAGIDPAQEGVGVGLPEPEMAPVSVIVQTFNEIMGNIEWKDEDRIRKLLTEELPAKVEANIAYRNAVLQGDRQNARVELDKALNDAILALASDDMELFKQYSDNPGFRQKLTEAIFAATFQR